MLRKAPNLLQILAGILAVQLADQHVLVGKELVQRADRHFRAARDFVEGEGLEASVDKHASRSLEDPVVSLAAACLGRAPAWNQQLGIVLDAHLNCLGDCVRTEA